MKTTEFVNKRDKTVDLNEGHAGSYSLLARVDRDSSFFIQVDPDLDPTQQELVVMDHEGKIIAKIPLTDLRDNEQITLTAGRADGSEHNNNLLKKKPRFPRHTHPPKSQEPSLLSKFLMKLGILRSNSRAERSHRITHSSNTDCLSALSLNSEMNSDAQDPE